MKCGEDESSQYVPLLAPWIEWVSTLRDHVSTSAESGRRVGVPIRHFAGRPEDEGVRMGSPDIHDNVVGTQRSFGLHCTEKAYLVGEFGPERPFLQLHY